MTEEGLDNQYNHQLAQRDSMRKEGAEGLYAIVSDVFDKLNTIPVRKRLEKSAIGIVPLERYYEKKGSKFKNPTNATVVIGNEYNINNDTFEEGINEFSILVNTGDTDFFAQSADSYKLRFHRNDNEISIAIGQGIFSRTIFDYPTILEIVINDQGQAKLGEETRKDILEEENFEALLVGVDNLAQQFVPQFIEGFVADVSRRLKLGEPKQIQASLQALEDIHAKSKYDSQLQALMDLTPRAKPEEPTDQNVLE